MPLAYPKVHASTPTESGDFLDFSIRGVLATDGVEEMRGFVLLRRGERTVARLFADLGWVTAGDFHNPTMARKDGTLDLLVRS
jgi:hypothetical protein